MLKYRYSRVLHWGECDPGGIIFSPNYARWMAEGLAQMFLSVGIDAHRLDGDLRYGQPLLEQNLRFLQPAQLHDRIEHEIRVAKVGTKSLTFEHRFFRGTTCLMEAREIRVWGAHPLTTPERLVAVEIPADVRAILTAPMAQKAPEGPWEPPGELDSRSEALK